jgi:hypothetical protein
VNSYVRPALYQGEEERRLLGFLDELMSGAMSLGWCSTPGAGSSYHWDFSQSVRLVGLDVDGEAARAGLCAGAT